MEGKCGEFVSVEAALQAFLPPEVLSGPLITLRDMMSANIASSMTPTEMARPAIVAPPILSVLTSAGMASRTVAVPMIRSTLPRPTWF